MSSGARGSLVCPADFLTSPLQLRLHCPSLWLEDSASEMAPFSSVHDCPSPTTQILSQKGISGPDVLITEASHRCESCVGRRKDGSPTRVKYPESYEHNLRILHKEFADWT